MFWLPLIKCYILVMSPSSSKVISGINLPSFILELRADVFFFFFLNLTERQYVIALIFIYLFIFYFDFALFPLMFAAERGGQ